MYLIFYRINGSLGCKPEKRHSQCEHGKPMEQTRSILHVRLRCGLLAITAPVSHLANELDGDTGGVIDSEPHLSRTCKTSLLFAQLDARVHTGCSAFLFCTPTKPLIRLNSKHKIVLSPKL